MQFICFLFVLVVGLERILPSCSSKVSDDLACPDPDSILPCLCSTESDELQLSCPQSTTEAELQAVFQADFPMKNFTEFFIRQCDNLTNLDFDVNGVTFERITFGDTLYLSYRISIESISDIFFADSAQTLKRFQVQRSMIDYDGFPYLGIYEQLEELDLFQSKGLTQIPQFVSPTLKNANLAEGVATSIQVGAFDQTPSLESIDLSENAITELKQGTFAINSNMSIIDLESNGIASIEGDAFFDGTADGRASLVKLKMWDNLVPALVRHSIPLTRGTTHINIMGSEISNIEADAFFIMSEPELDSVTIVLNYNYITVLEEEVFGPIMPYVSTIELDVNPLACECDIAWLVLDTSLMDKIGSSTRCANGANIHDLSAVLYEPCLSS